MVKKIKRAIQSATTEDELAKAIIAIHQTPVAIGRPSPAQLHFGRNLRDEIHDQILPATCDWKELKEWKESKKMLEKQKYDRSARDLCDLVKNQKVWVLWNDHWKKAWVIEKIEERPRSYRLLMLETGKTVERNRVDIRERPGDTDEDELSKKVINPRFLFSQEAPPRPLMVRARITAPAEEEDMEPETTNHETPPDNENYQESPETPTYTSTMSRTDSGRCPSNTSKKKSTAKKPTAKKKKKTEKPPEAEPPSKQTQSGREVKKPDRLIESM
jgi:hypothetical protein